MAEEILDVIEFIPEGWRGWLILIVFIAPRIIQKIRHGPEFKFLGRLNTILITADVQRTNILRKLERVHEDVKAVKDATVGEDEKRSTEDRRRT